MKKFLFGLMVVVLLISALPAINAQDEVIEIRFVHVFGDENRQGLLNDVIAAYEAEHPNVKIIAENPGGYNEVLDAALLGAEQGDAPHIVHVFEIGSQEALDTGIFVPVSSVATEEQLATLEDVIEPVRNYYTFGEEVWSLPWNSSNPVLYFNKGIFEAAGLDTANPPDTFSEVLAACDQIMATEGLELQGCIGWNMHSWFIEQMVANQGATLLNNDNGRAERATEAELDSEAMLKIFTYWKELDDKGYYVYTGAKEDWDGSDAIFTSQQVAMHITSTADLRNIAGAAEESGFEVGTGFLPIPDDATRNGTVVGGASLWLTADHSQEELEAAVDFMLFLGNTENMVDWHKGTGYFPVRYSSIEALEAEGWFEENPIFNTAFEQLTSTTPNVATAGAVTGAFREIRDIIESAGQLVVDQGVSPEEALAEADALADEAITFYNESVAE